MMKWKKYLAGTLTALVAVSAVTPWGTGAFGTQVVAFAEENSPEMGADGTAASAAELQACITAMQGTTGTIAITADFNVSDTVTIPKDTHVTICGATGSAPVLTNTKSENSSVFQVEGELTLGNITLTSSNRSGVYVSEGGTFNMEEGAVIQNGNAFLDSKIVDGTVVNTYYGGGVANYGTFVMKGGVIKSCRNNVSGATAADGKSVALYGGGVYNAGTFEMNGGEITGNQLYAHWFMVCNGYGGGVANAASGTFTMTGGTISGNSGEMGAGVYNAGTMNLSGGSIQDNIIGTDQAKNNHISVGTGIYNDSNGKLNFTGGSITGNKAQKGAGVYTKGTFKMSGENALISGNTASGAAMGRGFSCGGGVYVASGSFTLSEGKISSNLAKNTNNGGTGDGWELDTAYGGYGVVGDGGGVFVANNGADFTMTGGEISGNVASGNPVDEDIARQGGGVYVQGGESESTDYPASPGSFTMTGGIITENTALSGGDGVYIGNYDYFVTRSSTSGTASRPQDVYQFMGAAEFRLGGAASITGNENEDICLSDGVKIQITSPFTASDSMNISVGNKSENAVLAVYSEEGIYQEADAGRFLLDDIRTIAYDSGQQALLLKKQELEGTYTISLSTERVVFNGQPQEPEVTVTAADDSVLDPENYTVSYLDNTNAGTAKVTVTAAADGAYSGSLNKTFTITPKDISDSDSQIVVPENELTQGTYSTTYTGKKIEPSATLVVLRDQGRDAQMLRGTDYIVTFSDNTDAGTGKVILTGIGNYTGTLTYSFSIKKKEIADLVISKIADQIYTGSAITPAITIKNGNIVLTKGTDYTVTCSNNTVTGTATAAITGIGNYTGSTEVKFQIAGKSISSASVQATRDQVYTGKAIKPTPAVKLGGTILKKGTDYTLSYTNNKKTGKAVITIKGTGNYTGTRTTSFQIVPKKASLKSVTSKKKKTLTVKWKKDKQASGYQVMIAKNAKFTSGKKTKTLTKVQFTFTGLKRGKKYYAAVRSYKTIDGNKVYGAWSSYQTQTAK